ncbi:C40 family peptidase [Microbacterium sp. JZ31]|uniref:C40 family peptidase n=1 Tax=Microbacterium sp. JZ31 TaxID=1906274 RepID=UPI0019335715|nr:C40 family peptidase [Microbacterium sp. JZ31]
MSFATAADRIGAIQTAIQDLRTPAPTTAVTATAATSATAAVTPTAAASAADFQSVLNGVLRSAGAEGGATGADVVAQAEKYLGVPYVFGGEDASGMDCSGLVQRVFADLGIDVPRVVQDQADVGTEVPSLDQAQPGDLLVTKGEGHIVIYAGDGKIIHAPRPGKDVQLVDNYLSPSEISTIRRIVPAEATPVTAPVAGTAPAGTVPAAASAEPSVTITLPVSALGALGAPSAPGVGGGAEAAQLLSVMQSLFATQTTGLSSAVLS